MKYENKKTVPYVCDGCRKPTVTVTSMEIGGKAVKLCAECVKKAKDMLRNMQKENAPTETENNTVKDEIATHIERHIALMDEELKKYGIEIKSVTVRKIIERKRYIRGL